ASPRLALDATGHFAPATGVQLATGSNARLQLTPQAFAALQQRADDEAAPPATIVQLREPLDLALAIEQARYGWTIDDAGERTFDPANTSMSLRITSHGAAFDTTTIDQ